MKLFTFKKKTDYGIDLYFNFLKLRHYTALQLLFSYNDESSWPYMHIMIGNGKIFGMFFYVWKVGFDIDFFGRNWRV